MKKLFFISFAVMAIACGNSLPSKSDTISRDEIVTTNHSISTNGSIIIEERPWQAFSKIENKTSFDVHLIDSPERKINIEAPDNLVPYIKTTFEGGKLTISVKSNYKFRSNNKIVIYVPVTNQLKEIVQKGSGDIEMKTTLDVSSMNCVVNGSGDISVNVNAKTVDLTVQGSGDIEAYGSAEKLTVSVNGSGDIDAKKMIAKQADINVNGSGDAEAYVTQNVKAAIKGSGDVEVYGNPQKRQVTHKGSGRVYFK